MFMVNPLSLEWLRNISTLSQRCRSGSRGSASILCLLTVPLLLAQKRAASISSRQQRRRWEETKCVAMTKQLTERHAQNDIPLTSRQCSCNDQHGWSPQPSNGRYPFRQIVF